MAILPTEISVGAAPEDFAPLAPPPMVEKFHLPEAERTSETCGFSIVKELTPSFPPKIKGINATPALRSLAVRKEDLLKAGSSEMVTSSARTPPEKIAS